MYEDAVRADAQGKLNEAKQLAQQGLALSPHGPYAASLQRLLDRIAQEQLDQIQKEHLQLTAPEFAARASPAATRVSWVVSGAFAGIGEGILIAGAAQASGSGIAGGGLAGFAVGLAAALATMSDVSDPAVPAHFALGWTYGLLAGLAIPAMAQTSSTGVLVSAAIGLPVGALVGTLVGINADVTEGDAAAGSTLMLHLAVIPLLFAVTASPNLSPQAAAAILLAGGTAGLVAGELANLDLHWSAGRWAYIGLIGLGGALVAGLVCAAASATGNGVFAVIAGGDLVGLAIGVPATQSLPDEAPRGYRFPVGTPPAALNALPPAQGPTHPAPRMFSAPLAVFTF
jgi:hypothetical protein